MTNKAIISSSASNAAVPVHGFQDFVRIYKEYLRDHFKDVADGEGMLELGAKTSLIQELEKFFSNPMNGLLSAHSQMEQTLRKVVDDLITFFLKSTIENKLVKVAFKISSSNNVISYGIILKKDTFKNREEVLKFLSLYYTFEFADKIKVYFQFIPEKLKSAFDKAEYIS